MEDLSDATQLVPDVSLVGSALSVKLVILLIQQPNNVFFVMVVVHVMLPTLFNAQDVFFRKFLTQQTRHVLTLIVQFKIVFNVIFSLNANFVKPDTL